MFGYFCVKKRIGVTALLVCLVVAAIRVPRVVQYDVMNRSVQKARYCICIVDTAETIRARSELLGQKRKK